jgi:hypothetical protein
MPQPSKFTEAIRRERQRERLCELYPEYEAPTEAIQLYDHEAAEETRRAEKARAEFDKRAGKETKRLSDLAVELTPLLELSQPRQRELVAELAAMFAEIRWEWQRRRKIALDPSLPVLGGVQPTHGEMHETIKGGLRHALALRDWYRSLPLGLFLNQTVSMTAEPLPGDETAVIGVVIERLAETLAELADQYHSKTGRQPGERAAAQGAARWLIWFMDRHAPALSIEQRRSFVFRCMRKLGIPCPNLPDDQGDFNTWFGGVEACARPRTKADPEAATNDDAYNEALHRLTGKNI